MRHPPVFTNDIAVMSLPAMHPVKTKFHSDVTKAKAALERIDDDLGAARRRNNPTVWVELKPIPNFWLDKHYA